MAYINNLISVRSISFVVVFVLLIHSGIDAATVYIHYLNTSVFFLLYGVMFLLAFHDIKRWLSHFSTHLFLFLMMIWAVSSIFWTSYVYLTLLGSVSLLSMLLISFYLYEYYTMEEIVDLLVYVGFILLLINSIALIFFPEKAYDEMVFGFQRWKGVFGNVNSFSMSFYFFSSVFFLALYFKRPINKLALYAGLILSIVFLFQSRSLTSWLAMGIFMGMFGLKWLNVKKNIPWNWIFLSLFTVVCGVVFYSAELITLFNRGFSFSLRIDIWTEVWLVIQKNLLLGNGYLGFWYDEAHKIDIGPVAFSSHNGYLEIVVYFGFIGLFLFVLLWGRAIFLSAKLFLSKSITLETVFPFLFLITYSLQNTMESTFFLQRNLLWIVFIYVIIYLNNNARKPA